MSGFQPVPPNTTADAADKIVIPEAPAQSVSSPSPTTSGQSHRFGLAGDVLLWLRVRAVKLSAPCQQATETITIGAMREQA